MLNSPIPIAELRVGRHEKLVEHKKLTRFGVYSIRISAIVFVLFAIEGAACRSVWSWLLTRTVPTDATGVRSRHRLSWQQYAQRVASTMADISKDELRKEITGK